MLVHAHQVLGLGGVLSSVGLDSLSGLAGVRGGKILDLRSLLVDGSRSAAEVLVDELLVGDIDERSEEQDTVTDQGETPDWHELDEEVGDER